ncbi:hypothetical protein C8J57DRAFT_1345037 [Mycena rebaudengoi]|nr:hypothetical protein C8J57DRAFT_1345037 [Mycena rebaudengoi]
MRLPGCAHPRRLPLRGPGRRHPYRLSMLTSTLDSAPRPSFVYCAPVFCCVLLFSCTLCFTARRYCRCRRRRALGERRGLGDAAGEACRCVLVLRACGSPPILRAVGRRAWARCRCPASVRACGGYVFSRPRLLLVSRVSEPVAAAGLGTCSCVRVRLEMHAALPMLPSTPFCCVPVSPARE